MASIQQLEKLRHLQKTLSQEDSLEGVVLCERIHKSIARSEQLIQQREFLREERRKLRMQSEYLDSSNQALELMQRGDWLPEIVQTAFEETKIRINVNGLIFEEPISLLKKDPASLLFQLTEFKPPIDKAVDTAVVPTSSLTALTLTTGPNDTGHDADQENGEGEERKITVPRVVSHVIPPIEDHVHTIYPLPDDSSTVGKVLLAKEIHFDTFDQSFHIERDWWVFRYLLQFHRDGTLPQDNALLIALYKECVFWSCNHCMAAIEENKLHIKKPEEKPKDKDAPPPPPVWWKALPSWWQAVEISKIPPVAEPKPKDWWIDTEYNGKSFVAPVKKT